MAFLRDELMRLALQARVVAERERHTDAIASGWDQALLLAAQALHSASFYIEPYCAELYNVATADESGESTTMLISPWSG